MEPNLTLNNTAGKKPSLFGVIASPTLQFERMREKAPIGMPMFLLTLLYAIIGAAGAYFIAANSDMGGSVAAELPEEAQFFASPAFVAILGGAGSAIGMPFVFLVSGAFYKICMMLMGNDTTYKKLLSLSIYTSIIGVLGGFVNVLLMAVVGGVDVNYTSLAPLFEPGTMMYSIGGAVEVFAIWSLVVTAIALQVVAGLSKKQATILVVVFFLIGLGIGAIGGMFSSFAP